MPKVSVIIPIYNAEKYLKECLDSVIEQTLQDIEIICVDDGSTDNSLQILNEYERQDKRIKVLTQKNLHAGVARNNGLKVATGEYVHFLDSDDWIESEAYEKLYKIIKENDSDIVKFRAYSYNNETKEVTTRAYLNIAEVPKKCFETNLNITENPSDVVNLPDSPWSGLYKREFLINNNIYFDNFICANDTGFFYRCVIQAKKIFLTKYRPIYYRENLKNSLISKRAEHFDCQIELYNIVKEECQNLPESIQKIVINKVLSQIFGWYNICLKQYALSNAAKRNLKDKMKTFIKVLSKNDLTKYNQRYYNNIKWGFLYNIFRLENNDIHNVIIILGIKLKIKNKELIKRKAALYDIKSVYDTKRDSCKT